MKNINLKLDQSLIYEFLLSLFRLKNNDFMKFEELELEKDIKLDKEIVNWVENTLDKIPDDKKSDLEVYFNEESYFGICLISEIPLLNINSIEEYINYLKHKEPAYFLKKFTESGYGPAVDIKIEKVKELIQNEKKAADFVQNELNLSSSQKWNLLQFYFNPEKMKSDFINLLDWYYYNIFSDEIDWIKEKYDKINSKYQENLKRYGNKYLENILSRFIDEPLAGEKVTVVFSYFHETALLNSFTDKSHTFYLIGFRFPDIFAGDKQGLLGSLELFKSLADETRLNIISLLAEKTMYGNELAEKLNLSNATISHHVSKLLVNNIIQAKKEDNKLYYRLNKNKFEKKVLKSLENLF
jgi:DNA-binding transcriptional ArsR family regulator